VGRKTLPPPSRGQGTRKTVSPAKAPAWPQISARTSYWRKQAVAFRNHALVSSAIQRADLETRGDRWSNSTKLCSNAAWRQFSLTATATFSQRHPNWKSSGRTGLNLVLNSRKSTSIHMRVQSGILLCTQVVEAQRKEGRASPPFRPNLLHIYSLGAAPWNFGCETSRQQGLFLPNRGSR
jgi:hypothetical protein